MESLQVNKSSEKERYISLYYLKALAALLIVNSHFDSLYPIPALATGGAIGNAIFFAASGFLLYPITSDFKSWMKKRVIRIYVPVWIVAVITLLIGSDVIENGMDVFLTFIWPTDYWFVGSIIIFYLLYFVLNGVISNAAFKRLGIGLLILYFAYYVFVLDTSEWVVEAVGLTNKNAVFKLIYYFAAMMLGKYFAIHIGDEMIKRGGVRICCINAILAFVSIYGVKFLMNRYPVLMHVQFLNQLSVLWLVGSLFFLGVRLEDSLKETSKKFGHSFIKCVADYTFEIYLVQYIAIHIVEERLSFPINIAATILLIVIFAWILKKAEKFVYKILKV